MRFSVRRPLGPAPSKVMERSIGIAQGAGQTRSLHRGWKASNSAAPSVWCFRSYPRIGVAMRQHRLPALGARELIPFQTSYQAFCPPVQPQPYQPITSDY